MRNFIIYFCFLFIIISLLCACDSNHVYEDNVEIPDKLWDKDESIKFEVAISDTINEHNVYINVRNTADYSYSNLYLFVTVTSPIGESVTDTIECLFANHRGKWLGKGVGYILDNQILYKKNILFPISGIYTFEYVQAMRNDNLSEISDVGLKIERIAQ